MQIDFNEIDFKIDFRVTSIPQGVSQNLICYCVLIELGNFLNKCRPPWLGDEENFSLYNHGNKLLDKRQNLSESSIS